ncbi:MAG TPA: efflux RND transporter permease subunit, partial [Chthoniobacterales bacterium]|nr:efflux RND transporter permease subunit [Chthoniobacterales bacterium]
MSEHDRGQDEETDAPGDPREHRHGVAGEKTIAGKLVQFSSGLSRPFIQRPVMTMLLTASIIVFGFLTYNQLPVNDLPSVDYPIIRVRVSYPGANPETMANTIATPLEKQFTQIPGLELSTSTSTQGSTTIILQFNLEKGIDAAATDVQSAIQSASGQLPNDLPSPPTFTKTNPNDQPVMYLALTSETLSDGDLYKYASTDVQQRINILPGVSEVQVYGVKGAIRIKVDPSALASRNITLDELSNAIRNGTSYSGAGQFDGKNQTFILRPNGQVSDVQGYQNMVIARGKDGSPVYLRDVARVIDGVQDERMSRHFFARGYRPPASTIVFLENVVRRAEAGESIYKATLNSAGEISFTILSMTLSLAAVFIPLAFMPGLLGRIFREF